MSSHLGKGLPVMPWMVNFLKKYDKEIPDMQLKAINASRYLDYLCNLNINSRCGKCRLTAISCTLKNTNTDVKYLEELMYMGISMGVIDISFGTKDDHIALLTKIRQATKNISKSVGLFYPFTVALEMTGLRIRTGHLQNRTLPEIQLLKGEKIYVTTNDDYKCYCNTQVIYINYKNLVKMVKLKDLIYIDYGEIILEVTEKCKNPNKIRCVIRNAGLLRDYAIVHLPHVPQSFNDQIKLELLNFAMEQDVDVVIISNVLSSFIIENVRDYLGEKSKCVMVMARIESPIGVQNIDEIIDSSDGIVLARGELGITMAPEKLFIAQKSITAKCLKAGKPLIIASYILRSMGKSEVASRSDIMDLANTILDGVDVLQLSEEIIDNKDPKICIKMVSKICLEAEAVVYATQLFNNLTSKFCLPADPADTVAMQAVEFAMRNNACCIIVLTTSGRSAKLLSMYRPRCPIIAVTRHGHVARKLNVFNAVIPLQYIGKAFAVFSEDVNKRFQFAITYGKFAGVIHAGDMIILVSGFGRGSGFTNTLRVIYASEKDTVEDE